MSEYSEAQNWEAKKLKHVFTCNDEVLAETTDPEHQLNYIDIGSVSSSEGIQDVVLYKFSEAPSRARRLVREGDVIISTVRTYLEAIAPIDTVHAHCVVSTGFAVLRPLKVESGYAKYALRNREFIEKVITESVGISYPAINSSTLMNLKIPVPEQHLQRTISKYLDTQTTRIDALITEKQRFIDLLKEKRQALISHYVTKGLDPTVPMKDSGVEWIGEVPEHWAVAKLNFRYEIQLGKMLDEKKITGNHLNPYLRNTDVQWNSINRDALPLMDFASSELERYSVKKGDLLVCEGGEIGRCAIWQYEEPCFYQKALHRVRARNKQQDTAEFLFYAVSDAVIRKRFEGGSNKATIAHLPAEQFRQYQFAFPPLIEQLKIVEHLERENNRIAALTIESERSIELLKEHRTALISAAVTGKIDLRDPATPQDATP